MKFLFFCLFLNNLLITKTIFETKKKEYSHAKGFTFHKANSNLTSRLFIVSSLFISNIHKYCLDICDKFIILNLLIKFRSTEFKYKLSPKFKVFRCGKTSKLNHFETGNSSNYCSLISKWRYNVVRSKIIFKN